MEVRIVTDTTDSSRISVNDEPLENVTESTYLEAIFFIPEMTLKKSEEISELPLVIYGGIEASQ